jgi:predicted nucleic acid-binding protein
MSRILADTSGLFALLNRRDPVYSQARQFYLSLPRQSEIIIIEYVLVETMTLLRARGFSSTAVRFRDALDHSAIFSLRHSSPDLEVATYAIYKRYLDKEWSYVDCAILATADITNIRIVFSLDHHINQMGLQRIPT